MIQEETTAMRAYTKRVRLISGQYGFTYYLQTEHGHFMCRRGIVHEYKYMAVPYHALVRRPDRVALGDSINKLTWDAKFRFKEPVMIIPVEQ